MNESIINRKKIKKYYNQQIKLKNTFLNLIKLGLFDEKIQLENKQSNLQTNY